MARVRIKDIAQEAGVSPATVSRYLNNTPGAMTDETRARIAKVVERTGYRPLAAARSLRTDRSHLLGIVLADIVNPYSSAMIEALSAEAAKVGYTLMTAVSSNDGATEASAIERLCAAGADALVVNTCGGNEHLLRTTNTRVPVVLLDRDCTGGGLDLVTSNNSELMDALVDELCGCGCGRLVLLTEQDRTSSVRREREGRFLDRAAERGVAGQVIELSADSNKAAVQVNGAVAGDGAGAVGGEAVGLIAVNGLVFFFSPAMSLIGSPGTMFSSAKRISVTPRKTGMNCTMRLRMYFPTISPLYRLNFQLRCAVIGPSRESPASGWKDRQQHNILKLRTATGHRPTRADVPCCSYVLLNQDRSLNA